MTQKFKIAKIVPFQYPTAAILKLFKSPVEPKLDGGIGVKWRFRIAESFSSSIQDDSHGGNLETLQTTSVLNC